MNDRESSLRVRDIGEQGLLERLQRFCPSNVVGDDAAVVPAPESGQSLVVTTDMLVDGVHFSDRTTSPEDAGWRAAAVNLSDLAAMGAAPLGITVGLSVPGNVAVSWIEQLYQGMTQCLQQHNTPIVGGDVCRSPIITISITAFGQALSNRTIRRSIAKAGDVIVVTGFHGASRAGLELLLNPEFGKHLSESERAYLIQAHQRPKPRLDVLPSLWKILDSQSKIQNQGRYLSRRWNSEFTSELGSDEEETSDPDWATPRYANAPLLFENGFAERYRAPKSEIPIAGMDSSDGLADAVVQICRASGVGAAIERSSIPLPLALSKLVSPEQAMDWVLYGGEDFELVLCLPLEPAKALIEQLGNGAAIIGEITTGKEVLLRDSKGKYADELLSLRQGFQHF